MVRLPVVGDPPKMVVEQKHTPRLLLVPKPLRSPNTPGLSLHRRRRGGLRAAAGADGERGAKSGERAESGGIGCAAGEVFWVGKRR